MPEDKFQTKINENEGRGGAIGKSDLLEKML
jgi:hypothetical protein